ncbi:hypothetical protein BD410DRAFT_810631, partial [Rickenella mellea]
MFRGTRELKRITTITMRRVRVKARAMTKSKTNTIQVSKKPYQSPLTLKVDARGSIGNSSTKSRQRQPKFTELEKIAATHKSTEKFIIELAKNVQQVHLQNLNSMLSPLHGSDISPGSTIDACACQCQTGESQEALSALASMLSYIHLAASICKYKRDNSKCSMKSIYNQLSESTRNVVTESQLIRWNSHGLYYAILAEGGGIHILTLIAALKLKETVDKLSLTVVQQTALVLRSIGGGKIVEPLIRTHIIPTIQQLREQFTFNVLGANGRSIRRDDEIFQKLMTPRQSFSSIHRSDEWSFAETNPKTFILSPATFSTQISARPIISFLPGVMPAKDNIDLNFNVHLTKTKLPKALGPVKGDINNTQRLRNRIAWTEKERSLANKASPYSNFSNLQSQITMANKTRNNLKQPEYIRVCSDIKKGSDVRFFTKADAEQQLSAVLLAPDTIPQHLKNKLWEIVTEIAPDQFENGQDAPDNTSPWLLSGNTGQRLPHESGELALHKEEVHRLANALKEIFDVINLKVQEHFPDTHKRYELYIELLPLGTPSEFHPFMGMVININAISL